MRLQINPLSVIKICVIKEFLLTENNWGVGGWGKQNKIRGWSILVSSEKCHFQSSVKTVYFGVQSISGFCVMHKMINEMEVWTVALTFNKFTLCSFTQCFLSWLGNLTPNVCSLYLPYLVS